MQQVQGFPSLGNKAYCLAGCCWPPCFSGIKCYSCTSYEEKGRLNFSRILPGLFLVTAMWPSHFSSPFFWVTGFQKRNMEILLNTNWYISNKGTRTIFCSSNSCASLDGSIHWFMSIKTGYLN